MHTAAEQLVVLLDYVTVLEADAQTHGTREHPLLESGLDLEVHAGSRARGVRRVGEHAEDFVADTLLHGAVARDGDLVEQVHALQQRGLGGGVPHRFVQPRAVHDVREHDGLLRCRALVAHTWLPLGSRGREYRLAHSTPSTPDRGSTAPTRPQQPPQTGTVRGEHACCGSDG